RVAGGGDGGVTAGSGRSPTKKRQRPRFSASTSTAQEHDVRAPATPGSSCSNPSSTMDEVVPQVQQKVYNNDGGEVGGGLPSLGTWEKTVLQLEILKKITGKDDEELEWLITATQGNAVEMSERRRETAETEYHRLLFQESMVQAGMEILKDRRLSVSLKAVAKTGGDLERLINPHGQRAEEVGGELLGRAGGGEAEAELRRVVEGISAAQEKVLRVGHALIDEAESGTKKAIGAYKGALKTVIDITARVGWARELIAPAQAVNGLQYLEAATKAMAEGLSKTRRDCQTALESMELWRERKEALPEYIKHVAEEEKAWFQREAAANEKALRCMRSLIPVGVTGLTVSELEQRAIDGGSLYPRDLSLRLKENRLLHWTVMHPEDIARSNFLQGAHAHFFTNLDKYDLVEMRAVMACLPAKFEVDDDGRKAAWRAEFVQRAKGLVAQERGDTVRGGWDPKISARRQVRLPELSAGQARREEYFYPTAEKVQGTVDKLRERQRKLEAKQADLAKVRDELLPEARREYDYVLEDTRHPVNRATRTPEDLRSAREEAKSEVTR
ncbi:unnamed protein product, partial [Ectocarpus sp. 12 AP-2014]